ncbi:hypothetical protein MMC17_000692 [Xylographa soralifera]|nr:hypothetical protein [Xylographa soralifera]
MSTVRRRHVLNGRPWFSQSNNEDIHRTTSEELGTTASGLENERPSEDFRTVPSPHRNQSFATQLSRLKSIATRRITSMPVTSALSKFRHQNQNQEPKEQQLSPRKPSKPELYRSRGSYNFHVPTNSEDTSALDHLCRGNSAGRAKRSKSMSVLDASKTSYDQDLVDDINNQLKWLVSRNGNDYLKSIGSKYCGTSGRSGSPVTAYACESTSPAILLDDMSTYEAEGSLDGAVSRRESTNSIRMDMLHLSQYRKLWDNLPRSHTSSLSKSMPLLRSSHFLGKITIGSTSSRFVTPKAKAPSPTPTSTLRPIKRKRVVDRGIHVSMQKESESKQEKLIPLQSFMSSPVADIGPENDQMPPMKRGSDKEINLHAPSFLTLSQMESRDLELLSTPPNRLALVRNEDTDASLCLDQRDSPSTVKDFFIQNLHSKLDRLHYELSPGFRSPAPAHWKIIDENVPIWSQGPHKLSMPSRRRKSERQAGKTLRRSTASLQDLAPETMSSSPELTSWRVKLNRLRCRAGIEQLRTHATTSNAPITLPDETGIDTAAWILRQPPGGIGPDPGAANMIYLGGLGRARTLSQWQHGPTPTSRKRSSSQASLPTPPRKTLRRAVPMIKVRLKKDNGVWRPLGFVQNAAQRDGSMESENTDVSGSRRASAVGRGEGRGERGLVGGFSVLVGMGAKEILR